MRQSKYVALVPAALYLFVVAAHGAYVIYRYESGADTGELAAGMYFFLLTMPWSMFLDPLLREPDGSLYWDVGRLMLYGLVNAAIIYAAFALLLRLAGVSRRPAA